MSTTSEGNYLHKMGSVPITVGLLSINRLSFSFTPKDLRVICQNYIETPLCKKYRMVSVWVMLEEDFFFSQVPLGVGRSDR